MKYFLLSFFILSCSSIKIALQGFDIKREVAISESESTFIKKTGVPLFRYKLNSSDELLMFKNSYIVTRSGLVFERSPYRFEYDSRNSITAYAMKGQSIVELIDKIGPPVSINKLKKEFDIFLFNNGGFLVSNGRIFEGSDKAYPDNLIFKVKVNSYNIGGQPVDGKYFVSSGNKEIRENDLKFLEARDYVWEILKNKGFKIASTLKEADFVVLLNFGISEPQEKVNIISTPVFLPQYNPGSTANVYAGTKNIGTIETSSNWTNVYAGQETQTVRTVTYTRWLDLHAFDFKKFKKTKEFNPVWQTTAKSTGETSDIRYILPGLVVVAANHIASDTQFEIDYNVSPATLNRFSMLYKFEKFTNSK